MAAILVAVVVVVAGVGYVVIRSLEPSPGSPSSPPLCIGCPQGRANDVQLFIPFAPWPGQTAAGWTEGQSLPATVSLAGGEHANEYSVNWGDGSNVTQSTSVFSHVYSGLGEFVVSATALVGSTVHTGTQYLFPVSVASALNPTTSREFPNIVASLSNGTAAPYNYNPWVYPGQPVTVNASYSDLPNLPGYSAGSPTIRGSAGATQISASNSTRGANASFMFSNPGIYQLTMVGPIQTPLGGIYQNYTWTVYVGSPGVPLGCVGCGHGDVGSPHPGSIYAYEIAPGGAVTLDPAVDYETTGSEVIQNVLETLLNYNGSSTSSFVPVLSTCVPGPGAVGPTSCAAQYGGNDLTAPLGSTAGVYWTFPIDKNARFYDPATNTSWGVYPSDVMFSVARTLLWMESPNEYATSGWILGQSLLPFGQKSWDGGVHVPMNNTPEYILGSMLVNDSAFCPKTAMTQEHGCITFKADGSSQSWGYFPEFVQDAEGASVVPCGWYSAQGSGIPGFSTNAPNGTGPCLLPGGTNTTNSSAFRTYLANVSPTAYDPLIPTLDPVFSGYPDAGVAWNVVGSGPYWLQSVNRNQGYILKANPDYAQPNCAGQPNCYPVPGEYPKVVYVYWDNNSVTGVEQYIAGQSDLSAFYPTDIPTILNLVKQAKVQLFTHPTLNIYPEGFGMQFDPAAAESASGLPVNVPGDFFSYPGMRMLLAASFPYGSYINDENLVDGIPFIQGEGGAIPQYLGDYYPANITWPGMDTSAGQWPQIWSDPNTTATTSPGGASVGSPLWWWKNITTPGSPYYDPEAAACSPASPCNFTLDSEAGMPALDQAVDLWISVIQAATGGALAPLRWDPTFSQYASGLSDAPGQGAFDTSVVGWLPDYPDPADFVAPLWMPDATYTYTAAYNETLESGAYNGLCGSPGGASFADLAYWANYASPLVPTACQGTAYQAMVWAANLAAGMPPGSERSLFYNLIEHVASKLVLDVYDDQQVAVVSCASWVNPAGFDTNVMAPGQLWFNWFGLNVV